MNVFGQTPEQKAAVMEKETLLLMKTFDLPPTQRSIQNYRCAFWRESDKLPIQGRLYITQAYACWTASMVTLTQTIPLSSVDHVSKENTTFGLLATALTLSMSADSIVPSYHLRTFAGSGKRDEAFYLLQHLIAAQKNVQVMESSDPVPMLLKSPSGGLYEGLLLVRQESFVILDADGSVLDPAKFGYRRLEWSFRDIDQLVLRSRPLHLDVTFNDGGQRLRMASFYIKSIVRALVLFGEVVHGRMDVVFEPGIEEFDPRGVDEPVVVPQHQSVTIDGGEVSNDEAVLRWPELEDDAADLSESYSLYSTSFTHSADSIALLGPSSGGKRKRKIKAPRAQVAANRSEACCTVQ